LTDTGRDIELLDGEALFIVAPDAARPFTVGARTLRAQALGTRFDVDQRGDRATVTVLEHAVRVDAMHGSQADSVTIGEGERISYSAADGWSEQTTVPAETAVAWQRGKLIVESQPLGDVIAHLNRYHRGTIVVTGEALRALRVTGVFDITDPDGALRLIARTLRLRTTSLTPYLVFLQS
jgi:transmembrane sensor